MVQILPCNTFTTAKWIVDPTLSNGTHSTIQAAITSASSGDTVFVRPGTYTESLALKAGVHLTSFSGNSQQQNVNIVGKATLSSGTATISNVILTTNSDFVVAIDTTAIVNLYNCTLSGTNGSLLSTTSSGGFVCISCTGGLTALGLSLLTMSAGSTRFNYCNFSNGGASVTNSTASGGSSLYFLDSTITMPFTTSGTALFNSIRSYVNCPNTTALTIGGTGNVIITENYIAGGTGSALSVGVGATAIVSNCTISSSNTNAITGAGAITYGGLNFISTSSTINTTTQALLVEGPSRTIGSSNSGATNTLTLTNTSNTASSAVNIQATVAGGTAADAQSTYTVTGGASWATGVDNSASDAFVIAATAALGTTNVMSVATTGEINFPLQSAFMATSAGATDVTGDGTVYTIIFGNEIFDQNSDFDGTSTYTAPVTGRYQLSLTVASSGYVASTAGTYTIVTSNRTYTGCSFTPIGVKSTANGPYFTQSLLGDMDAADTAVAKITISGEAGAVVDITANVTKFSGYLAC